MYQFSLKAFSVVFDVAIQVLFSLSNLHKNLFKTIVFMNMNMN